MYKRLLISLSCLMIACCSFSQDSYPRQLVAGSDTIVAITRAQMRQCVQLRYALDACDSDRAVLDTELGAYQRVSHEQDSIYVQQQEEMRGYDAEVVLLNDQLRLKEQERQIDLKIAKRKRTNSILGGVMTGVGTLAAGFLTGWITHK